MKKPSESSPCDRREERHRRRTVEAFAAAGRHRPEKQDRRERSGEAEAHRRKRPENQRERDDPLPVEPVAEKAGQERRERDREEKDGVDVSELAVRQREVGLDVRQQDAEDGAVGLMEEVGSSQQEEQPPLVAPLHFSLQKRK